MSNNNPTPDGDSSLHAGTLLAVLAKLRDRLAELPALADQDAADHELTAIERAEWAAREETLELFSGAVALMLKDADPGGRVVVLPEPDGVDEDDEPYWPGDEFQSVTVELSVENKHYIYFPSSCQTVDQARIIAGSILAAIEFAGGAQ